MRCAASPPGGSAARSQGSYGCDVAHDGAILFKPRLEKQVVGERSEPQFRRTRYVHVLQFAALTATYRAGAWRWPWALGQVGLFAVAATTPRPAMRALASGGGIASRFRLRIAPYAPYSLQPRKSTENIGSPYVSMSSDSQG